MASLQLTRAILAPDSALDVPAVPFKGLRRAGFWGVIPLTDALLLAGALRAVPVPSRDTGKRGVQTVCMIPIVTVVTQKHSVFIMRHVANYTRLIDTFEIDGL